MTRMDQGTDFGGWIKRMTDPNASNTLSKPRHELIVNAALN
jgi:hypothetical protein